jgi:hypothetical protein
MYVSGGKKLVNRCVEISDFEKIKLSALSILNLNLAFMFMKDLFPI